MSERIANLGLMGRHIEDSLSSTIHNTAYEAMGLEDEFMFGTFEVPEYVRLRTEIREFMPQFLDQRRLNGVVGLAVTMPFKEDVMASSNVISTSSSVQKIGAINTLLPGTDNMWMGENTDWLGILHALGEADVEIEHSHAVVVGTGGAARAAIYTLALREADEIVIAGRTEEKTKALAREFRDKFPHTLFRPVDLQELNEGNPDNIAVLEQSTIVINASMAGQVGTEAEGVLPINTDRLKPDTAVMDVVYKPVETPLIKAAEERRSLLIVRGSRMLLHQAAAQVELFTGEWDVPVDVMHEVLQRELTT